MLRRRQARPSFHPSLPNVTIFQFPSKPGLAFTCQWGSSRCGEVTELWAGIPGRTPGI